MPVSRNPLTSPTVFQPLKTPTPIVLSQKSRHHEANILLSNPQRIKEIPIAMEIAKMKYK